jgi:hypothetical protein
MYVVGQPYRYPLVYKRGRIIYEDTKIKALHEAEIELENGCRIAWERPGTPDLSTRSKP